MRKIVSSFTLELSRRICAAAANWLTVKRVKTYGISLPLVGAAVLAVDTLAKQSLLLFYKGDFILFIPAANISLPVVWHSCTTLRPRTDFKRRS